ncbi:MAG: AAA-like domain-containing protein [Rhodothermaceae bacterium]|nr:AAA-like domain-containing protein [Rhodothermaceae bacterium]
MSNLTIYTEGGPVQANDGRYLPREADKELMALCSEGQFSYVLTARQMGKSSLMIRTAERLEEERIRTVIINLNSIGTIIDIDKWFFGVLAVISDKLFLDTDLYEWWDKHEHLGVVQRFVMFFEDVVLIEVEEPIVIFIDEVDTTLGLPYKADFFAAIRHLHNERSNSLDLKRLTFSLIGVATPSDLINDPRRTPFNIGVRVHLDYFTLQEAMPLSDGFDLPADRATQVLLWVMNWTGGHPYLTQRLCKRIAEQDHEFWTPELVAREVRLTFFEKESEEDNLRFVSNMLTERSRDKMSLLKLYRKILYRHHVKSDTHSPAAAHLVLSGVVKQQFGSLRVSNGIYAHIFNHQWLDEQMAGLLTHIRWYQRIPTAAWFVAAAVIMAFIGTLLTMQNQRKHQAEKLNSQLEALNDVLIQKDDSTDLLSEQLELVQDSAESLSELLFEKEFGTSSLNVRLWRTNQRLADAFRETDSLSNELKLSIDSTLILSEQLSEQIVVADSLRTEAKTESQAAKELRLENATFVLANKALSQASMGNTELGALLARQAFEFNRMNDSPFQNTVYQALRETLNAHAEDIQQPGGPFLLGMHNEWVRTVAYSPDAKWIASAGDDGRILLNQAGTMIDAPATVLHTDKKSIRSLSFHPSNDVLAAGYHDGTLQFWHDYSSEKPTPEYISLGLLDQAGIEKSTVVTFSPGGSRLLHAGGRYINVYDEMGQESVARLAVPEGVEVNALAINERDALLIVGGSDGGLYVFNNYEQNERKRVLQHDGPIQALALSPDGRKIATGGRDTVIRLWTLQEDGEPITDIQLRGHEGPINTLAYDRAGHSLISGSSDGSIQLWDIRHAAIDPNPVVLTEHDSWVWSLDANPLGGTLVSSGADRTLRLWTTDPQVLADRICMSVPDRNLSPKEWHSFVGEDLSYAQYHKPCPSVRLGLIE